MKYGQKFFQLLMIASLSLALANCSKKNVRPDGENGEDGVNESTISEGQADSDSDKAMGLQTVHFPYDSNELTSEGKEVVSHNAAIMKDNESMKVQIEGHCDERGGIQYNLALGERRANTVRQAMIAAGVKKSRLTTISMGKEKPIAHGSNEEAWAKNRRANFVITEK
jgi:peptidoglycan-associated lipoprotein